MPALPLARGAQYKTVHQAGVSTDNRLKEKNQFKKRNEQKVCGFCGESGLNER